MPCNAAPSPVYSKAQLRATERKLWRALNRATQVACRCVELLQETKIFREDSLYDERKLYDVLSAKAKKWATLHQKWDVVRKRLEKVGTPYADAMTPVKPTDVTNGGVAVPGGREYEQSAMTGIEDSLHEHFDEVACVVAEATRILKTAREFHKLPKSMQAWALRHEDWDRASTMLATTTKAFVRKASK